MNTGFKYSLVLGFDCFLNNYKTKDGKWVALSCSSEKPYERLMKCIGRTDMIQDHRFSTNKERIKEVNRKIVNEVISDWISQQNLDDVITLCERNGITIGPISTMADIARDIHYRDCQSIIEIEDPTTGKQLKLPNVPFRLSPNYGKVKFPGLPLGSANKVIYSDLLSLSHEKIDEMKQIGLI